jgi:hypothetical protein
VGTEVGAVAVEADAETSLAIVIVCGWLYS